MLRPSQSKNDDAKKKRRPLWLRTSLGLSAILGLGASSDLWVQADPPRVIIGGEEKPVVAFSGWSSLNSVPEQPAQSPTETVAENSTEDATATKPTESTASDPAELKFAALVPSDLDLSDPEALEPTSTDPSSNELPTEFEELTLDEPRDRAQPDTELASAQPNALESSNFVPLLPEAQLPVTQAMLDEYAAMPEVGLELIHELFGEEAFQTEQPRATPNNGTSHAFEGLGLTEVSPTAFAAETKGSDRFHLASANLNGPSERIERERNTVESLLRNINNPQTHLAEMQSIQAPTWLGQIHFAMLRYGTHIELSLDDAIYTAIQYSPEIEILRAEVAISQAEITRQQAGFDWGSFINSNWDERNVPVGSNLDGAVNRLENHTLANSLGITKRTTQGGNVRLGQDLGLADSNSVFFVPQNQATSQLALEFQQPLLQGAGLLTNTSRINIAIANATASHEQFVGGLQSHILSVTEAYWNLSEARGEFIVLKRSYERALETAAVVSNRVHLDVGPVQSARSEATLGTRRAALLRSEFNVVLAQERLLRLIFGQYFGNQVNTEVIPSTTMIGPSRTVDMDMEVQVGLQCRPEVRESLQVIKRTAIEQGVAQNQLLPLLGLTMRVSNRGLRGNEALGSAFHDQFNFGDPTYGVGVAYELPVGNRAAKANLRQAQIRLVRFQKEFETVVSNVALEIRNACHNVANTTQQREVTAQAMRLTERELEVLKSRAELLLDGDNVGPLYLDDLLTTQERLAAAELAFLRASSAHALSYFELQRANGSLMRAEPVANSAVVCR